ncbi:MAG: AAA family ATPase [candidate division WOR-3 bacterium]
MLKIKKITFKNLLKVGNQPIEYDFVEYGKNSNITVVTGKNGTTKSCLLDAISFAFFGKPYRKINKNELINNINKSNLLVNIKFSYNNIDYELTRGLKPNVFELKQCNNNLLNSGMKDLQSELESIIKIDNNIFNQAVLIGCNYSSFFELSSSNKRKVLEELFNLDFISTYSQFFKDKLKEINREYDRKEAKIEFLESCIKKNKEEYNRNLNDYKTKKDEYNKIKVKIEESINSIKQELNELNNEYKKLLPIKEKYNIKKQEYNYLLKSKKSLIDELKILENKMAKIKDKICPTCNSIINHETNEKLMAECKLKIETVNKKIQETEEKIKDILQNSISFNETDFNNIVKRIDELNKLIKNHEKTIKNIDDYKNLEPLIISLREKIDEETKTKTILEQELKNINSERKDIEKVIEILSDDGIKKTILKSYLQYINKCYNKILNNFNIPYSVYINEDYDCSIKSYNGDELNYYSLSQGEKSRVNLSMILTIRELTKKMKIDIPDLIVLDEIFDSALDSDGLDSLINTLYNVNCNVVLITHKEEIENVDANTKHFKKQGNFTICD